LGKKPYRRSLGEDGGAPGAVLCTAMASLLSTIILPIAVGAVALVLLLGLLNMMRGGSPNRSQKLMRLRVLLQFVAIIITMLAVWAMGH
jgi:Hypoxia induced protein conserved region